MAAFNLAPRNPRCGRVDPIVVNVKRRDELGSVPFHSYNQMNTSRDLESWVYMMRSTSMIYMLTMGCNGEVVEGRVGIPSI